VYRLSGVSPAKHHDNDALSCFQVGVSLPSPCPEQYLPHFVSDNAIDTAYPPCLRTRILDNVYRCCPATMLSVTDRCCEGGGGGGKKRKVEEALIHRVYMF